MTVQFCVASSHICDVHIYDVQAEVGNKLQALIVICRPKRSDLSCLVGDSASGTFALLSYPEYP